MMKYYHDYVWLLAAAIIVYNNNQNVLVVVDATSRFPPFSQQCRDDAGPPFGDDESGRLYHDGSAAIPMLKDDGECATPLREACTTRGNAKTAYLEGPLQCNGNGWYCRILVDENWPPQNLIGDLNFGYCNKTEAIEDSGYDRSGHCHGSSDDSTYYWWLRDHWFRQYNGRLRCCCNWNRGPDALASGRLVNRCDYRRLVTPTENVEDCRDANEDNNLSYEGGCNSEFTRFQLDAELPENDEHCWEVLKFGDAGNEDDDEDENEDSSDNDSEEDEESDEERGKESDEERDEESEEDEGQDRFTGNMVKMCMFYEFSSGHARSDPIINQSCASDHVHTVVVYP